MKDEIEKMPIKKKTKKIESTRLTCQTCEPSHEIKIIS